MPHKHHSRPVEELTCAARVAQRLYAPLGTELSLGEYVRLTQRFVDLFAHKKSRLSSPVKERKSSFGNTAEHSGFVQGPEDVMVEEDDDGESIDALARDLKVQTPGSFQPRLFVAFWSRLRV